MPDNWIVVTDGQERAALALTRSLGRSGWQVCVVSDTGRSLAGASRWARTERRLDPASAVRYSEGLSRIVEDCQARLVIPTTESTLLRVRSDPARLPDALIPFPDLRTVQRATDKTHQWEAARRLGIAVPASVTFQGHSSLGEIHADLTFPLVVKPHRSVVSSARGPISLPVRYASSIDQLRRIVRDLPEGAFPLLLQQRIEGPGVGAFLMVVGGEAVATFFHRRIRERPPSGGVSVYRESVEPDPQLAAASLALLRELDWWGVAMVEYKTDLESGVPYLMEVNPRFWGSLQLAIDAGVDFPSLLVRWCVDGIIPERPVHYRVGVRSRWLWGEVDHFLARVRARTAEGWEPGLAEARACLAEQLGERRPGTRLEILRRDDPRPFLRESVRWFRDVLR